MYTLKETLTLSHIFTMPVTKPSLSTICSRAPRALEQILSFLSGSEAACLLAVLGLLDSKDGQIFVEKFVRPIRDIPEYECWLENVTRMGHRAHLVGRDISRWVGRMQQPLEYWRKHGGSMNEETIIIWLSVRAISPPGCLVLQNGENIPKGREVQRLRSQGAQFVNGNLLPAKFEARSKLPDRPTEPIWRAANGRPNAQNIQVVWAEVPRMVDTPAYRFRSATPKIQICPIQGNCRSDDDAMCGYHFKRDLTCNDVSPGAHIGQDLHRNWIIPSLPYMDLDGQLGNLRALRDGERFDDYAVLVEFRCLGSEDDVGRRPTGPDIRSSLQGIPWI